MLYYYPLNAFINHIHKQSVMAGNRHTTITSYKCHITSPRNSSFNSQVPQGQLMIDHHPLIKSNCPGNDKDCFITVEPLHQSHSHIQHNPQLVHHWKNISIVRVLTKHLMSSQMFLSSSKYLFHQVINSFTLQMPKT